MARKITEPNPERHHIRVVQEAGHMEPDITIAETGKKLEGVMRVEYDSASGEFATLTLTLAALVHEVDIELAVMVEKDDEA